ncbi:hypothetical protein AB1Y20_019272 [Prymnesium parvum]|uniref:GCVT N-terminal domain-containing protein n=1 Tax=Prymnesium parvum TaxID=97485 RepID=A0AB34JQW8_PRYPA
MLTSLAFAVAILSPSSPRSSWLALGRAASSALLVERPSSVLQLDGPGRKAFLHGLCTANVNAMSANAVLPAAVLDAKGNTLELLTLVETGGGATLAIGSAGCGEANLAFFERFIFPADEVRAAHLSDSYTCLELLGPSAAAVLARVLGPVDLPAAGTCLPVSGGLCLGGSSLSSARACGYTLLLPRDDSPAGLHAALAAAVAHAGGVSAPWEEVRILCGRPARDSEFTAPPAKGSSAATRAPVATPLELGLWSAVHLDKGCFLGQEVIARVARAKRPRRELYGIQFDSGSSGWDEAVVGAPLVADGAAVGVLTSLLADPTATPADAFDAPFGLGLVKAAAARVGARVSAGGLQGVLVELPCATRVGMQAGGAKPSDEQAPVGEDAKEEAKEAERERKAAKLAAMQAKLEAFQARQKK